MNKRIFRDIDQNTDEWFTCRMGKVTASNFGTIMAHYGKDFGEPAKKYAMKIVLEKETGKRLEGYSNRFMERGIELEPMARTLYEIETCQDVKNGGFMDYGRVGGSADGIVGNGLIEIKSVIYSTHFQRLYEGGYDSGYQWQIQGNLWLYEKDWCDFVSYCPEFPISKSIYIFRVQRDEEAITKLNKRIAEFFELIDKYKSVI